MLVSSLLISKLQINAFLRAKEAMVINDTNVTDLSWPLSTASDVSYI
jgi:hypothetical protein